MAVEPRILVVDDDLRIIRILSTYLEVEGFSVETAMNAEGALDHMEHVHPDALILDVMLPGIDGVELCRMIRKRPEWHTLPIIMFSARSESQDIDLALEAGASRYVTKPSSLSDLVQVVRELLNLQPIPKTTPSDDDRAYFLQNPSEK